MGRKNTSAWTRETRVAHCGVGVLSVAEFPICTYQAATNRIPATRGYEDTRGGAENVGSDAREYRSWPAHPRIMYSLTKHKRVGTASGRPLQTFNFIGGPSDVVQGAGDESKLNSGVKLRLQRQR